MKVKKSNIGIPSARAADKPATRKMLFLVRDGLKSEMKSQKKSLDSKFLILESKIMGVDAKIDRLSAEFSDLKILVEEQNANNRIVLEGLQSLWQRQEKIENLCSDKFSFPKNQ